ncbi:hypothetical protein NHH03_27860 [Stieleria sp. TO1_6]|uniref:hypothetical protein n=1 Tax=Stieleria tagensis TaxID=2956795 RepID=UPI00209B300D|nr:hypothetical protein [Stieleria tagensis]MCO8125587.1 hypothetical protein [Stieleria tagensis]
MGGSKGNTKFDGIRWDKHFQTFVADRNFNGQTVGFTFDTNQIRSDELLASLTPTANRIWMTHNSWFKKFRDFVAADRLSQFRTLLSQEDPPLTITAKQIRDSLTCPYMITIRPLDDSDCVRIDFSGGGHDWGGTDSRLSDYHVEASATLDGGFDDATIFTY